MFSMASSQDSNGPLISHLAMLLCERNRWPQYWSYTLRAADDSFGFAYKRKRPVATGFCRVSSDQTLTPKGGRRGAGGHDVALN